VSEPRPTDDPSRADRRGHPGVGVRPTWEPWLFGFLVLFAVAFGVLVEHRSVFADRRRTDAGVFFRAGYAWRAGLDPYHVSDDNRWYLLYPPGVAPAFGPLADPPHPAKETVPPSPEIGWHPPYAVSIALWYALSVACVVVCIECLSRALIRGSPDPLVRQLGPNHGGWWNVRLWPLVMCLPDICSTLSRGQINLVLLACISAGILLFTHSRWFWGGFLMSLAACIKVLPGILLLDIIMRRGRRAILGYVACVALVMIAVPAVCYGPARGYQLTCEWGERVLVAGLLDKPDRLQAGSGFQNTDNCSIQGSLHNLLNIATPRGQRPREPDRWVVMVHVSVAAALTCATLLIGRRRTGVWAEPAQDSSLEITLRVGMLLSVMLLAAPMCHRHYFVVLMPAVSGLVFVNLMRSPYAIPNGWGAGLIPLYPIVMTIPRLAEEGTLGNLPEWLHRSMTDLAVRDWPIPVVVNMVVWALSARALAAQCAQQSAASISTR
jgi:hypothetical protein